MHQQSHLNRAQRRRARRNKAFAGAGLALTTSLVGVFPGSSRYARAYLSPAAATDTANCDVSTWAELKAALDQFNLKVTASDNALEFACSTITFTADIDDVGLDASAGQLPQVGVANDSLTIDGNGNTLSFAGANGYGLGFYQASSSVAEVAAVTVTDLEMYGTPFEGQPSIFVTAVGDSVALTVENSWIHENASTVAPALQINNASPGLAVDILHSEFSYNGRGAFLSTDGGDTALYIAESFFHDNYSGGSYAGAISVVGSVSIVDSTFSDNESLLGAGGISVVHSSNADPISVSNSTFWDNNGGRFGSLDVYVPPATGNYSSTGDIQPTVGGQGVVTIDHSTFAAGDVGEIHVYSYDVDSTFTLTNSIVWSGYLGQYDVSLETDYAANFTATVSYTAIQSMFAGGLYDLDASGTNITGVMYPQYELNPLGDNGGTVLPSFQFGDGLSEAGHIPTMLPTSSSVVIDAAGTGGPATDQRGVTRPQGDAADMGAVEVEPPTEVTVTVTPTATQTIDFGDSADLTPTYAGFAGSDTWETEPTCEVYDDSDNVVSAPYPVGTYTIKCSGGTLPTGYVADYTATGELVVEQATATLTYTGTAGSTTNSSINLSASISPVDCPTSGLIYKVNGVQVDPGTFAVTAGNLYEIEVSYDDPNCAADPVYAIVLAASTSDASSGGGYYNVSGAGKINFGYTVQVNKSRNGSTQVSGQILWNSQNGKFRFKGVITGFVKTTTDCAPGTICGRLIGTGTLRTRNELGEWVIVGTGMSFKSAVIDAGTASVCTGGRKSTCSTVNKPDFFGIDVLGVSLTGEQPSTVGGWPTPVQLSGGNVLIK